MWASGEARIRVARHKLLRGAVVDESFVQQPTHCPALSSNITQGVPRGNQLRVVLIDQILESSERPVPARTGSDGGQPSCH